MIDQALVTESWGGFGARFRFSEGRSAPGVERFEVDRDFILASDNWACRRLAAASLLFDGWIGFIGNGGGT